MQSSLTQQGIELMLYGMGTVVTFLILLIFATNFMTSLLGRYFKQDPIETKKTSVTSNVANEDTLTKVIKKAIEQYRTDRK